MQQSIPASSTIELPAEARAGRERAEPAGSSRAPAAGQPRRPGGLIIIAVFGLMAILSPVLLPYNPQLDSDLLARLKPPSWAHPFGTDALGRDILMRILHGARVSLGLGVSSVVLAGLIGSVLGLLAGYAGRRIDLCVMFCMDILLAFPATLLAIAIVAMIGPGLRNALIAISVVSIPFYARITRGEVLSLKEREFVTAARGLGGSARRIVLWHIFPNTLPPLAVQTTPGRRLRHSRGGGARLPGPGGAAPDARVGRHAGRQLQVLHQRSLVGLLFPGGGHHAVGARLQSRRGRPARRAGSPAPRLSRMAATRRLTILMLVVMWGLPGLTADAGAAQEGVFRINNMVEPESLDPALVTGVPEHRIISNLFEGLTTADPKDLSPRPGMAESWRVSKDGVVYTFTLREARWTDGRPVTAHDFVYAWERVLNPKTGAKYAQQLYYLKNGEAYNRGRITDFSQVGVKALNDRTLQVTLRCPTAYFLDLTSFYTLYPAPRWAIEAHGRDWVKPGTIVSNGPFRLVSWVPQNVLVLEKNPQHWDAGRVKLQQVSFLPTENVNTAFTQFLAGESDWVPQVPTSRLDAVRGRREFYASPYLGTYFFRVNVTKPPLNDLARAQGPEHGRGSRGAHPVRDQGGPDPGEHVRPRRHAGLRGCARAPLRRGRGEEVAGGGRLSKRHGLPPGGADV